MDRTGRTGERIILTGASSGIGAAMAREYGRRGARIVLVARRRELLDPLAADVASLGGTAVVLAADVTAEATPVEAVQLAGEKFGGFDRVIMNAGISAVTRARSFEASQYEHVMAVNYLSVVRMIEASLPILLAAGRGHLVAVSSLAAYRGMPGAGAYNASKAAVTVLMESLRTELRGSGVDVTTVAPGFVRTAMTDKNEFHMPFMIEVDAAARLIVRRLDRKPAELRFPLPLSLAIGLSRLLPNALYDWIVVRGRSRGRRDRVG